MDNENERVTGHRGVSGSAGIVSESVSVAAELSAKLVDLLCPPSFPGIAGDNERRWRWGMGVDGNAGVSSVDDITAYLKRSENA